MTPFVWMFIKNYENLRHYIINNKSISSLIQLEYSAFSEATVPICTFVLYNNKMDMKGIYFNLTEYPGGMEIQNKKFIEINSINNKNAYKNKFYVKISNFNKIPGSPIAYLADENYIKCFESEALNSIGDVKVGLQTGDNTKFLRYWFEVNLNKCNLNNASKLNKKWLPYNKGGSFRKWYGNHEYVINWENEGEEIKKCKKSVIRNPNYYFKPSIGWSTISSSKISFRYYPEGFLFDTKGSNIYVYDKKEEIFAFLNSNICQKILEFISPTIDYSVGSISKIPIILDEEYSKEIKEKVSENIKICKNDWDENETSWNFSKHPLLKHDDNSLKENYGILKTNNKRLFNNLKNNEIRLNEIFSKIYNVKIDTHVEDKYISISSINYSSEIQSFISYSIGCMFGRYSLDQDGLQFAGGEFNINNYHKFIPDDDNIIPVLDTAYFDDDIVGYFTKFVETCFGSDTLEENLDFIARSLSKSNKPSREVIRQYLLKNFFNDHKKTYKKCPIYWQFSSGKENGFNCLVYMHRYEPSLVARIRTDYLHKTQKAIEQRIANNDDIINNSTSKQEVTRANKEKVKLQKQLKETQEYDEVLAHIANQNIEIDLDDGVKENYTKFQNIEIKKEGSKTKKVNLLKKI